MVQVLGKRDQTPQDFEWLYHALDVITTLDPHYAYAYQVGGMVLTEVAHRVDLSNRLLEKGLVPNPTAWWLPFNLGYNYFFYLGDHARAAEYMAIAGRLPGRPSYLPGLATRMYAEAGNPHVALNFLESVWRETDDRFIRETLEARRRELWIERDIRVLDSAVERYRQRHGHVPPQVADLVNAGELSEAPQEPFGGEYRIQQPSGKVFSSSHPQRLRVYRPWESAKENGNDHGPT
jgi:hypothetical protein